MLVFMLNFAGQMRNLKDFGYMVCDYINIYVMGFLLKFYLVRLWKSLAHPLSPVKLNVSNVPDDGMQWPQYLDLKVNGIPVKTINRPGSKTLGANGCDDGPSISRKENHERRISKSVLRNPRFCHKRVVEFFNDYTMEWNLELQFRLVYLYKSPFNLVICRL